MSIHGLQHLQCSSVNHMLGDSEGDAFRRAQVQCKFKGGRWKMQPGETVGRLEKMHVPEQKPKAMTPPVPGSHSNKKEAVRVLLPPLAEKTYVTTSHTDLQAWVASKRNLQLADEEAVKRRKLQASSCAALNTLLGFFSRETICILEARNRDAVTHKQNRHRGNISRYIGRHLQAVCLRVKVHVQHRRRYFHVLKLFRRRMLQDRADAELKHNLFKQARNINAKKLHMKRIALEETDSRTTLSKEEHTLYTKNLLLPTNTALDLMFKSIEITQLIELLFKGEASRRQELQDMEESSRNDVHGAKVQYMALRLKRVTHAKGLQGRSMVVHMNLRYWKLVRHWVYVRKIRKLGAIGNILHLQQRYRTLQQHRAYCVRIRMKKQHFLSRQLLHQTTVMTIGRFWVLWDRWCYNRVRRRDTAQAVRAMQISAMHRLTTRYWKAWVARPFQELTFRRIRAECAIALQKTYYKKLATNKLLRWVARTPEQRVRRLQQKLSRPLFGKTYTVLQCHAMEKGHLKRLVRKMYKRLVRKVVVLSHLREESKTSLLRQRFKTLKCSAQRKPLSLCAMLTRNNEALMRDRLEAWEAKTSRAKKIRIMTLTASMLQRSFELSKYRLAWSRLMLPVLIKKLCEQDAFIALHWNSQSIIIRRYLTLWMTWCTLREDTSDDSN